MACVPRRGKTAAPSQLFNRQPPGSSCCWHAQHLSPSTCNTSGCADLNLNPCSVHACKPCRQVRVRIGTLVHAVHLTVHAAHKARQSMLRTRLSAHGTCMPLGFTYGPGSWRVRPRDLRMASTLGGPSPGPAHDPLHFRRARGALHRARPPAKPSGMSFME